MIVTKVKGPLLRQRQPGGKLFAQDIFERANLLVIVDSLGCAELAQMFLIEIVQHGKNTRGHRRSGAEILILDRCVDAGICGLLHGLVDREQAAQRIGRVGAGFVETHGQNLLRAVCMWIVQVIRF